MVDGKAEFASLPLLYPRLQAAIPHQLVNPILADIQPLAPVSTIAKKCLNPARQLSKRGVERVVVLVDRETRAECCATLSRAIEQPIANPVGVEVHVVLKDRAFENWLIAAVASLRSQRARFRVSASTTRLVAPNMADNVDALDLLKQSVRGSSYSKVSDSKRILGRADPLEMAANSRSFRRFLRCVDHPLYVDQSQRPIVK